MHGFRYKAFISYSHQDEAWGRWLQRSLESYRVPRRLVGTDGRFGPIGARVAPVFRDREDLSSAADLTASVKQELAASESLVVICSPAAAASRWVNEEVEYFRGLGRGDRILALIVEGDPGADDGVQRCFPPALLRDAEGAPFEPLAADARKSADGRALARLKLVAGILGTRLDDLRQRDMQRKHRLWMISAGGAIAVAITTTVLAIAAINARDRAENRREQAENLVGYMVNDLQDDLQEVGRLDILQGMGGEVSRYLETLDQGEVTDTSLEQQALVWRHLGSASMDQWKLDDAMKQFSESRDVLRELHRRDPGDIGRLYELSQAEFWVGSIHIEQGDYSQAEEALRNYLRYADMLAEKEPDSPRWLMEQSMAHGNLGALVIRRESDDAELALEELGKAVQLNHRAIEIEPDNEDYLSAYSEALAWQADAQKLLCDLGGALKSRQEGLRIARTLMERRPGNAHFQSRYAYALTGLANVARQLGMAERASDHFEQAAQVLGALHAADPTNVDLRWGELIRKYLVAMMQAETSDPALALASFESLHEPMTAAVSSDVGEYEDRRQEWIRYLLDYASAAWRAGRGDQALALWSRAVEDLGRWIGPEADTWQDEVVTAKFLGWSRSAWERDPFPGIRLDGAREHLSCPDRSVLVLQALVEGEQEEARSQAEFLLGKGYHEPGFVRICRQYALCRGAAEPESP